MKTVLALAAAALAMALASPAAATRFVYDYHGTVTDVFGPDPAGVAAGDDVHVVFQADTSIVTDVTAATNAFFGTSYFKVQVASLTAPGDYLHIEVGGQPVSGIFDGSEQNPFWPDPFGAGGAPYVLFLNGAFAGVDFFGINPTLAAFVTAGAAPEFYDFVGGSTKAGGPSYGGFFDYSTTVIAAGAPEPADWSLMIAGFGLAGTMLRRRRIGGPSRRSGPAAMAALLLAAVASPAFAGPPAALPTITVAYADLSLSSSAGALVMLQRIRHAAAAACEQGRMMIGSDIETVERFETCRREATEKAVARLSAPLVTDAYEGRSGSSRHVAAIQQAK